MGRRAKVVKKAPSQISYPLHRLLAGQNVRIELRTIIQAQDPDTAELGAGGGGTVDVDAVGNTGGILAAQAYNLSAARLLIEPCQAAYLAITPERHRGRVAAHHDRTLALGR